MKELTGFDDLDTVYAMPPEYKSAIVYNGAVWVASEYEREPPRSVYKTANRTKKAIETQNKRNNKVVSYLNVPSSENQRQEADILRGY